MGGNINFGKYRFDFLFSLIFGALHVTLERIKSNLFKIEWLPFLNRASIFVSLFSEKEDPNPVPMMGWVWIFSFFQNGFRKSNQTKILNVFW